MQARRFSTLIAALLAVIVAPPLAATSTVTTVSGDLYTGRIHQAKINMIEPGGGSIGLKRESLRFIQRRSDGTLAARFKVGLPIAGKLDGAIYLDNDTTSRSFKHDDIQTVVFDQFVLLDAASTVEDCPIRGEIPLGGSLNRKTVFTARSQRARCGETFISGIEIKRLGKPGKAGYGFNFKVFVAIAEGDDEKAHIGISLRQDGKDIGTTSAYFDGDEGETNIPRGLQILIPPGVLDLDGPPPSLRFQLITSEWEANRGKGTRWWWFTQRFAPGRR